MIFFHKIIPLLISPIFLVFLLIFLGLIFNSRKTISAGAIFLVISGLPVVSSPLIAYLEKNYVLQTYDEIDAADAIVVLGGIVRTIEGRDGLAYEWNEASDRFFAGIDLFKNKKAPHLIFTRGKLPWTVGKPEGEYLRDEALKLGVPERSILLTENVQNTMDEAQAVRKILKEKNSKIILVTSAFHMPRALIVFNDLGLDVIPAPVDFQSGTETLTLMDFLPSAAAFRDTSFFVREIIGRLYYNILTRF